MSATISREDLVRQAEVLLAQADADYEPRDTRPLWRGWLHTVAFFLALAMAAVLVPLAAAQSGAAALATSVYCAFMAGMFGTSALYHRRRWAPRGWRLMKRLDHCMIFLFIAGTYTPFGLLTVGGVGRWVLLGLVWGGCAAGILLKLFWPTAPRYVGVPLYLLVSWPAIFFLPQITANAGVAAVVLLLVGGLAYTVGGICYGIHRPNPVPGVFGYHEVFHACTIVAAICQYIAVFLAIYHSPLV